MIESRYDAIEDIYRDSTKANIKNIKLVFDLEFDQFCLEIARQSQGEYLVFVYNPISNQQLSEVIRKMQSQDKNIATDPQNNYLIVRRIPFLQAGGFSGDK